MNLLRSLVTFLTLLAQCSTYNDQVWRVAGPRNLSDYKPASAFINTQTTPVSHYKTIKQSVITAKPGWKSFDDVCGQENISENQRIIGGTEASPNQWPWQVLVFMDDEWYCGGTIISDDYIMTAGHCVDEHVKFDVVIGAHDATAEEEPNRIEITSYEASPHPDWNPTKWYGDIGLIKLPEKLSFNTTAIRPACLPPPSDIDNSYVPGRATATGWGKTSDTQTGITPVMHYVSNLPVIDNAACMAWYSSIIYPGMMCIDSWGPVGVCHGDSGSSLHMIQGDDQHKWTQVGITSFVSAAGCENGPGHPTAPHGFTKVAFFLEWIQSVTGLRLVS